MSVLLVLLTAQTQAACSLAHWGVSAAANDEALNACHGQNLTAS